MIDVNSYYDTVWLSVLNLQLHSNKAIIKIQSAKIDKRFKNTSPQLERIMVKYIYSGGTVV